MRFYVSCSCGKEKAVTGGDAGSVVSCPCGKSIDVPSLHRLRHAAGMATLSPDVMIETLLRENRLPEERHCANCGVRTDDLRIAEIFCQQALAVQESRVTYPWFLSLFAGLFGGAFGWLLFSSASGETEVLGEDIFYLLPVRLCTHCGKDLTDQHMVRLFQTVPVYQDLLFKYPNSRIRVARPY